MKLRDVMIGWIKNDDVKIIAEVGVFKSLLMQMVLEETRDLVYEYWAIDPWKVVGLKYGKKLGYLTWQDWQDLYKHACSNMQKFQALKVLRMLSTDAARIFPDEYFDLVFIDADHSYHAVRDDIIAWYPKVKTGGILAGHDMEWLKGVTLAVKDCFGITEGIEENRRIWLKVKDGNIDMDNLRTDI
ncbi:MAG TPA: class I SAM-dependent methyltransferase [bacterium]|nr:class I SAM-dependent methyltransferase [bacterium]